MATRGRTILGVMAFRRSEKLLEELRGAADTLGMTLEALVRQACERELAYQQARRPDCAPFERVAIPRRGPKPQTAPSAKAVEVLKAVRVEYANLRKPVSIAAMVRGRRLPHSNTWAVMHHLVMLERFGLVEIIQDPPGRRIRVVPKDAAQAAERT